MPFIAEWQVVSFSLFFVWMKSSANEALSSPMGIMIGFEIDGTSSHEYIVHRLLDESRVTIKRWRLSQSICYNSLMDWNVLMMVISLRSKYNSQ